MKKAVNLVLSQTFKDGLEILREDDIDAIKDFLQLNDRGWHVDNYWNILEQMGGTHVKYKPIYGVLLIWHMSNGKSFESFGAVVGVVSRTCNRWVNNHPEFKVAHDVGMLRRRMEWEEIITTSAKGQNKGNAASIIFALKNYFPDEYKDKREVEHTGNITIVDTGITRPLDGQVAVDADYTVLSDDSSEDMSDGDFEESSEQRALGFDSPYADGQEDEYSEDMSDDDDCL